MFNFLKILTGKPFVHRKDKGIKHVIYYIREGRITGGFTEYAFEIGNDDGTIIYQLRERYDKISVLERILSKKFADDFEGLSITTPNYQHLSGIAATAELHGKEDIIAVEPEKEFLLDKLESFKQII